MSSPTIDLSTLSNSVNTGAIPPPDINTIGSQQPPSQASPVNTPGSVGVVSQQPVMPQQPMMVSTYMPPIQSTPATSNINVTINDKDGTSSVVVQGNDQKDPYMFLKFLNGLCLVGVGIVILGEQTGLLEINYYNIDMIQVGSLMIICSGLFIILMRSWMMRLIGSVLTVAVLIGIGMITFWLSFGPESTIGLVRNVEIQSDNQTLGTITFESIVSSFSLQSTSSTSVITASIYTDRPLIYTTGNQRVDYQELPDRNPLQSINSRYVFALGTKPLEKLSLKQWYGTNTIDLTTGSIDHVLITASSATTKIVLGPSMSGSVIDVMGGWVDLDILLGRDVGVMIEYKPAWGTIGGGVEGSLIADSDPTRFTSSNYITSKHKVTIRMNMIIGSLSVEQLE